MITRLVMATAPGAGTDPCSEPDPAAPCQGYPRPPDMSLEPPQWLQGRPKISLFVPQKDRPSGSWSPEAQASLLGKLTHLSALGGSDSAHGFRSPETTSWRPEMRCGDIPCPALCAQKCQGHPGKGWTDNSSPLAVSGRYITVPGRSVWKEWKE